MTNQHTCEPTFPQRFWVKVEFTESCWTWKAFTGREGYGHFWNGSHDVYAHRWAYEFCVAPIPDGLTIDHLCRVRNCVNPDHLEPVTHRENTLRGIGVGAINSRRTHCIHGHAFTPENTLPRARGSGRECRTCRQRYEQQRPKRKRIAHAN